MNLPADYRVRPPTIDYLQEVAQLCDLASGAVIGLPAFETADELLTGWYGPARDLTTSLDGRYLLVVTPDDTLVAYLETDADREPGEFFFRVHLHPNHRSEALYRALRQQAERWAVQAGVGSRCVTRLWEQDDQTRAWVGSAGYTVTRFYHSMEIDLDGMVPPPVLPRGFRLDTYRPGADDTRIHQAWNEAMADDVGTSPLTFDEFIFYKVTREKEFDPTLWFFAMDGEEIAGFVLARWSRPDVPAIGHIRDVGVRPAYRRRGPRPRTAACRLRRVSAPRQSARLPGHRWR